MVSSFTKEEDEGSLWNNHVELGLWADLMVIAPATANTLSKMASGNSDNFLLATYLSAKCPVYFAPAMDLDMYQHPSTRNSIEKLTSFGNHLIPAGTGELASGLVGEGRMAEPEEILSFIEKNILEGLPLRNKRILITAGPTYEAIDPVRFIGNPSSGKMGFELAQEAAAQGAEVLLISGPTHLADPGSGINLIRVESAQQMYEAALEYFPQVDAVIAAAAVSDYRPKQVALQKIKKKDQNLQLELEPAYTAVPDADASLRQAGPALVPWTDAGGAPGVLLLLAGAPTWRRRGRVALLGPDGRVHHLPRAALSAALCQPAVAPLQHELDELLATAAVPPRRRAAVSPSASASPR